MNEVEILLVEDNPRDLELTLRVLRKNNLANSVVTVTDGEQALDFVFGRGKYAGRDTRNLPVVVLLDLKLPRLGGLEVLKRLREDDRTKRIPVVILTTSTEQDDLVRAGDLHANSYVRKPVDFDTFVGAARQLRLYWTVLNEPAPPGGS